MLLRPRKKFLPNYHTTCAQFDVIHNHKNRGKRRAYALTHLGATILKQSDFTKVRAIHEESLTLYRQTGNRQGIAYAPINLGLVAKQQGDYAGVWNLYSESLTLFGDLGEKNGIADALGVLGKFAERQSQMERAVRLLEAAASLRAL